MTNRRKRRLPGEGERSARRGYVFQDRASAHLLCEALLSRKLRWVGLADRLAGVADDLVLGLEDTVVGHQFKNSATPKPIGLTALLLGNSAFIADLARSFECLRKQFPGSPIFVRFLTVDPPSENDRLVEGVDCSTTEAFIKEKQVNRNRSLAEWRTTRWAPVINELVSASGLGDSNFEIFWNHLDLVLGEEASMALDAPEDAKRRDEIEEVARAIPALIVDTPQQDRWSRAELLAALGWRDPFATRFLHTFPVGEYVQKNDLSESQLVDAIKTHGSGYLSLVGSPGTGKSTLLQTLLRDGPNFRVIRYLAFVPGSTQGQGRGEAESFYEDVSAGLADTGLQPLRIKDQTLHGLQHIFDDLLVQASQRYQNNGTRYVIVVDGLDHIPREERPDRSMLSALPLPQSIPEGVLFVLGTQRLDLDDLPPSVREDAARTDRRIDIAPLSEDAVIRIAAQLGLPDDIAASQVYAVAEGHPLVTRYLIKRLILADGQMRDDLLAGQYGFDGDLEDIYAAAWRGIENLPVGGEVKRVLALVGHADGPIEPRLLASATSDEAVEGTLVEAAHLLSISTIGWTAFHNSFRLFLQTKRVEKFGKLDPDYSPRDINRKLSKLAGKASEFSPQRWLEFHYLYKAEDYEEALRLGDRGYFVEQYCAGRSASAIRDDINDAFHALSKRLAPGKLLDLLLARDEVDRRAEVMEGAASLPDAYVAIGDLQGAWNTLSDGYEEGRQWVVVDALLDDGKVEEARRLFENHSPFRPLSEYNTVDRREVQQAALPWATRAVIFMDENQLKRLVSQVYFNLPPSKSALDPEPEDVAQTLQFQIARAYASADPTIDLQELAVIWDVTDDQYPIIVLEAAFAAADDGTRALYLLRKAADHPAVGKLHISWLLDAARRATRMGHKALAQQFLEYAPLQGLDTIDDAYDNEVRLSACRHLANGVALRIALGEHVPELGLPKKRLMKGVQYHLISIASAIGQARTDNPPAVGTVESAIRKAINFLAAERTIDGEDHFSDYYLSSLSRVILDVVFTLVDIADVESNFVADFADDLISRDKARFRWWPYFRRQIALGTFAFDGDVSAARKRLEDACEAFDSHDPRARTEQATSFALAFARIGDTVRANEILSDLRREALAVFLAAKKDGQYELWNALLGKANSEDPSHRAERANLVLRLIDGLQDSEGSNMGPRIVRQALFEAAAFGASSAWNGARWSALTGAAGWDGIVDSTLRGVITRKTLPLRSILTTWSHLCLPWYAEPHGSSGAVGQFLKELIQAAELSEVEALETAAASAIAERSRPEVRLSLLGVLEEAATHRGQGQRAREEKLRWSMTELVELEANPDNRLYHRLTKLSDVLEAIEAERAYFAKEDKKNYRSSGISWGLERALSRVLAASTWQEAKTFAKEEPELAKNFDTIKTLMRVALAAGERDTATDLAAPVLEAEEGGWEWMSGHGSKNKHELRHLLGMDDAYEAAQRDFFQHLTTSRYGVRSMIWEIDTVFPLLFDNVDWVELWNSLEAHIRAMRDFKVGHKVDDLNEIADDSSLMAALHVWAISLGVPLVRDQAIHSAHELRKQGNCALFGEVVLRLLVDKDENALVAMDLLTEACDDDVVCEQFSERLQDLTAHSDAGVAASAMFLASVWQVCVSIERRDLPPFYDLHLPSDKTSSGHTLSDQQTRGLVIDDVMAWTEGWTKPIKWIAKWSGVSEHQIRFRVGQLVQTWGGVEAFGHQASKRLEQDLSRIDLKLTYRRPQAEVALRAMRHVAGELWRAGRLSIDEIQLILFDLHASPRRIRLPTFQQRPTDLTLPELPKMLWGETQEAWLESVSDDVAISAAGTDQFVFAEWYRITAQDLRSSITAERFAALNEQNEIASNLDELIGGLPRIIFILEMTELYEEENIHPFRVALFDPRHITSPVDQLLVFCPLTAAKLSWVQDSSKPYVYRDNQGDEMARTIVWRDGLPQQIGEDAKFAEGQRIVLSAAGLHQFKATFGNAELVYTAWRHVERKDDPDRSGSHTASTTSSNDG